MGCEDPCSNRSIGVSPGDWGLGASICEAALVTDNSGSRMELRTSKLSARMRAIPGSVRIAP